MPTALPARPVARTGPRRLTLSRTIGFLVLLGRMRLLDRRMTRLSARSHGGYSHDRRSETDRARLLAGARQWLALSARIAALTGIPEPPHARAIRAIFADEPVAVRRPGER